MSFQYYLRIHQHEYDVDTKTYTYVIQLFATDTTIINMPLATCFVASDPSTPVDTTSTTPGTFSSPAMKIVMLTSRNSSKTKKEYYGGLDFFDSQDDSTQIFSIIPTVLLTLPTSDGKVCIQSHIKVFPDQCKLDIFIHSVKN